MATVFSHNLRNPPTLKFGVFGASKIWVLLTFPSKTTFSIAAIICVTCHHVIFTCVTELKFTVLAVLSARHRRHAGPDTGWPSTASFELRRRSSAASGVGCSDEALSCDHSTKRARYRYAEPISPWSPGTCSRRDKLEDAFGSSGCKGVCVVA